MLNFDLRIAHYSSEFHFRTAVLRTLRRSSLISRIRISTHVLCCAYQYLALRILSYTHHDAYTGPAAGPQSALSPHRHRLAEPGVKILPERQDLPASSSCRQLPPGAVRML